MAKFKRVYSAWTSPVAQLGVAPNQSRVLESSRLTPAVLRQYGSKLVVLDEASRALEHCGQEIDAQFLKSCRPRMNRTNSTAPAVQAVYRLAPEPVVELEQAPIETVTTIENGVPVTEVVEVVEVVEAVEVVEEVTAPKKGRKSKKTQETETTEE